MSVESAEEREISLRGVPVIDVSSILKHSGSQEANNNMLSEDVDQVVADISAACKNWGFYYVTGHGIDPKLIAALRRESRALIALPKELKRKIARTATNFRGYFEQEYTKQKLDWKEGYDLASIDGDVDKAGPDGFPQWPSTEELPEFKSTLTAYFQAMAGLSHALLLAMWKGLDGDPVYLEQAFKGVHTSKLRVNYYGKCPDPSAYLGVGPHTDSSALTVLLQDDAVNSLQVQRHGQWYNVPPVPNSFVINTGDMAQVWSNGLYKAPVHRVLSNQDQERYSFPFFYAPSRATMYEPLPQCVTPERPLRYRPINWGHFRSQRDAGNVADLGEEIQIWHYEIK